MTGQIKVGSVVFSKSGRDSGKFFVCVKVLDAKFVLLCDGEIHKLNKPKKKNIKHLKPNGEILETVKDKLFEDKKIFDSEIRKSLRPYNELTKTEEN